MLTQKWLNLVSNFLGVDQIIFMTNFVINFVDKLYNFTYSDAATHVFSHYITALDRILFIGMVLAKPICRVDADRLSNKEESSGKFVCRLLHNWRGINYYEENIDRVFICFFSHQRSLDCRCFVISEW